MMLIPDFNGTVDRCIARVELCPWPTLAAQGVPRRRASFAASERALYTPEQRRRRDESPWTLVQGILAPLQFLIFLVSLALVIRFLATGAGFEIATASIVVKTLALYAIMVTGAIWERAVFGRYLFAPAFFWEDVVSMLVIALHTAYIVVWFLQAFTPEGQMLLALAAYAAYVINAAQFLLKLRTARLESGARPASIGGPGGGLLEGKVSGA